MHRTPSADLGCTATFSYNIKHAHLSPAASTAAVGCQDPSFPDAQETTCGTRAWTQGPGLDGPCRADVRRAIAFLFDTGVDRAVHGHFMSKLLQLWALSHAGDYVVSHVVLFRRGFRSASKSSMSAAQLQLLRVVTEAIARKQQGSEGDGVLGHRSALGGSVPLLWADDVARAAGALRALCVGRATLGSGYENLVGSSGAARAFRALMHRTFPAQRGDLEGSSRTPPYGFNLHLPFRTGKLNATMPGCPRASVLLLHRGHGSSAPRRVVNVAAVREALNAAAAELGIALPPLVERETDERLPLDAQVELFRSFGLMLSSHSSALKNLAFAEPHAAVVEVQPTESMTNVFLIDVHHFDVHFEISKGHTPVECGVGSGGSAVRAAAIKAEDMIGVAYDTRRKKWRASIRVGRQENTLGFFDSPEAAARKHDVVAASIGRSTLNFPLQQLKGGVGFGAIPAKVLERWAWKCNVEVNISRLTASLIVVLKRQEEHCPGLWLKAKAGLRKQLQATDHGRV
jgi:hypothetical protein